MDAPAAEVKKGKARKHTTAPETTLVPYASSPLRETRLTVLVSVLHLSIDVGMRNLGVFCVLVDAASLVWLEIVLLSTFDVCSGVETGGKKCTSVIATNAAMLLDALTVIHGSTRLFIEEQFISKGKGPFMMNDEARRMQSVLLGYFTARRGEWGGHEMIMYRVPSVLKLRGCPTELRKKKPKYKEWTRLQVVQLLKGRGFYLAASIVDEAPKGDDVGDAVKQYVEAIEEVRLDPTKYVW
jgi:hypothetical protein